jgi:hypothetical protein
MSYAGAAMGSRCGEAPQAGIAADLSKNWAFDGDTARLHLTKFALAKLTSNIYDLNSA